MRLYFKPKTKLGKWSAWIIVAFAVSVGVFPAIYFSQWGGVTSFGSLVIALVPASPLGIAAFITGIISIIRGKEQSIAVRLAVVFGSLSLFGFVVWILLITFPH
jgi:hypothetical protein